MTFLMRPQNIGPTEEYPTYSTLFWVPSQHVRVRTTIYLTTRNSTTPRTLADHLFPNLINFAILCCASLKKKVSSWNLSKLSSMPELVPRFNAHLHVKWKSILDTWVEIKVTFICRDHESQVLRHYIQVKVEGRSISWIPPPKGGFKNSKWGKN